MFKHILMPVDGSELSDKTVAQGIALAKALNAKVTALVAEPEYEMPSYSQIVSRSAISAEEHERRARTHAQKILDQVAEKAKAAGVSFEGRFCEEDEPHQAIIRVAEEAGCDLVAMGSHGRHGVSAVLFGSETHEVMAHSKIPVLVYR